MTDGMEETIAAIATSPGTGGLSVIRISGKNALTVADAIFRSNKGKPSTYKTHTIHHGVINDGMEILDEVLLSVMRAPRSYTMEDVVEISCHGGLVSAKRILELTLSNGARLAHAGEFTRRAFINGRIDLTQAEAVLDIISAQTEGAHTAAVAQLEGHLYQKLQKLYDQLSNSLANVEAHIDFPDEDIQPETREQLSDQIQSAAAFQDKLLATARDGRVLRQGVRVIIMGKPNVGKSSLLNALLGHERAIVSPTPGTTRDTIEEVVNIEGLPLYIIDTAGLRDSAEEVEKEGMARAKRQLESAELVLLVIDSSKRLEEIDRELLLMCKAKPIIIVLNKMDLGQLIDSNYMRDLTTCSLSVKSGDGLAHLKKTIAAHLWQGKARESFREIFINTRHQEALLRSRKALERTLTALKDKKSFEYLAADLREALQALGEVNGRTVTEDVLDRIFSTFCIGK